MAATDNAEELGTALRNIANAIRSKKGTQNNMTLAEMPAEIMSITGAEPSMIWVDVPVIPEQDPFEFSVAEVKNGELINVEFPVIPEQDSFIFEVV